MHKRDTGKVGVDAFAVAEEGRMGMLLIGANVLYLESCHWSKNDVIVQASYIAVNCVGGIRCG